MIQRIQSLYLFLVTILTGIFLSGNYLLFINNSGSEAGVGIAGLKGFSPEGIKSLAWHLVTFPVMAAAFLTFISIFLFRKRILQSGLALIACILNLLALAFMVVFVIAAVSEQAKPQFCLRSFLPLVNIVLLYLAYRRIKKDENMVKSLDRLR